MLATAVQVSISRQSTSGGTTALNFLDWVDEEKYLTLAMLGDASDEGLSLLRFTDSERMDTAEAQEEVGGYEERMNALFLQSKCQHVQGFTKYAINNLQKQRVLMVGVVVKNFGGPEHPTPVVLHRCLQRMACYARLAIRTLRTEFPNYELIAAFSVFNISDETCRAFERRAGGPLPGRRSIS